MNLDIVKEEEFVDLIHNVIKNNIIHSPSEWSKIFTETYKQYDNVSELLANCNDIIHRNSGGIQSLLTCCICNFKWNHQFHGIDAYEYDNKKLKEIKSERYIINSKLSGRFVWSDFSIYRLDRYVEGDYDIILTGVDRDTRVLTCVSVPMNNVLLNRIKEKHIRNKAKDNISRSIGFSYKDFEDIKGVKVLYLADDYRKYCTKPYVEYIEELTGDKLQNKGDNVMQRTAKVLTAEEIEAKRIATNTYAREQYHKNKERNGVGRKTSNANICKSAINGSKNDKEIVNILMDEGRMDLVAYYALKI